MTPHRVPIQAKTPLTSTKKIGRMIDHLETETQKVERKLMEPNDDNERLSMGLVIGMVLWIVASIVIAKLLGWW